MDNPRDRAGPKGLTSPRHHTHGMPLGMPWVVVACATFICISIIRFAKPTVPLNFKIDIQASLAQMGRGQFQNPIGLRNVAAAMGAIMRHDGRPMARLPRGNGSRQITHIICSSLWPFPARLVV